MDYDLLAGALSGPRQGETHGHPEAVRQVAYRARTAAIREALRHTDKVDVYVIHSMPKPEWLAIYAEHGAEIVTIDPGRDVVMQRIAAERPATARAVAARWYNQTNNGTRVQVRGGIPKGGNAHPHHPQYTPPPRPSRQW
ncbi:hypothetical protein ACFWYW_55765 [Nonomuraea sp. NPDC059023]|uniref:hypothetical protein n=1 Tax=unclassified Nonomuraea TaxID=2593643 RepID=UPI00368542C7